MISFASGCPLTPVDPDLAGQACLKKHLDNDCGIYSTETYRDFIANRHEVSAQNVGPDNLSTLANETTDVDLPSRLHLFQRLPGGGAGTLVWGNAISECSSCQWSVFVRGWVLSAVLRNWLAEELTHEWETHRERSRQAAIRNTRANIRRAGLQQRYPVQADT